MACGSCRCPHRGRPGGLESYVETKEHAEELEAKIDRTDALIDEIVYELYGLTDEEIEIVEEVVGE
nr:hypothetical protein [Halorhabdus amylolytica]